MRPAIVAPILAQLLAILTHLAAGLADVAAVAVAAGFGKVALAVADFAGALADFAGALRAGHAGGQEGGGGERRDHDLTHNDSLLGSRTARFRSGRNAETIL